MTIRNGSTLIVTNGASLEDVEIIMEIGAKLKIMDNGKVHLRNGVNFVPPQGAIVEIEYGENKCDIIWIIIYSLVHLQKT